MLYMVGSIVGAASAGPGQGLLGRRKGYVYAGLLFVAGNLGVSLALNMPTLVAWRLLEGLGAGLMIAQSYGMVGDLYPRELRVRVLSIISTTWGVADGRPGPLLGDFLQKSVFGALHFGP